jgi:hypothetical protein
MPTETLGARAKNFLLGDLGQISYDDGIVASGNNLEAGTVLGQITTGGKLKAYTPGASDGTQNAYGVLTENVDATSADQKCVAVTRLAEIQINLLKWGAAVTTDPHKTTAYTALAAKNIIAR